MARMSIDDAFLRDPRIDELAEAMGWSRRETMGALIDLWAVCYDQVSAVLSPKHVNRIGGAPTFSDQLVAAGLAKVLRGEVAQVRICGVEERIGYLATKREAGRQGGVKSGKSRRSKREADASFASEQTFEADEAPLNPSPSASPSADPLPVAIAPEPPQPTEAERAAARQVAIKTLWQEHQALRQKVASEVGAKVAELSPNDGGLRELRERISDADMVHESLDAMLERGRHVLSVVAAECREKKSIRWFDGMIWRRDRFDRTAAQPLEKPKPIQVIDLSAPDNPFLSGAIEPMFTVDPE